MALTNMPWYSKKQVELLHVLDLKRFTAIEVRIFLMDNGFSDISTLSDVECDRILTASVEEPIHHEYEAEFSLARSLGLPDSEKMDRILELVRKS